MLLSYFLWKILDRKKLIHVIFLEQQSWASLSPLLEPGWTNFHMLFLIILQVSKRRQTFLSSSAIKWHCIPWVQLHNVSPIHNSIQCLSWMPFTCWTGIDLTSCLQLNESNLGPLWECSGMSKNINTCILSPAKKNRSKLFKLPREMLMQV